MAVVKLAVGLENMIDDIKTGEGSVKEPRTDTNFVPRMQRRIDQRRHIFTKKYPSRDFCTLPAKGGARGEDTGDGDSTI